MAQPVAYTLAFSFTNHSANYPTTPHPGVSLDNEFRAISVTTGQIRTNLALIQRDDGQLKNGIVTADALSSDITLGLRSVTTWAAATAYLVNDAVWVNSALYRCLIAHTSTAAFASDLSAGKWVLVTDLAALALDAVVGAVIGGIEIDDELVVDLLAGKASIAEANIFQALNTFLAGIVSSRGTATTELDYLIAAPTDAGAGKPTLYLRKSATAGTWEIVIDDGSGPTGTLNLDVGTLTKGGVAVLTQGDIDTNDVNLRLRRARNLALAL
jgi:hypothetical protein